MTQLEERLRSHLESTGDIAVPDPLQAITRSGQIVKRKRMAGAAFVAVAATAGMIGTTAAINRPNEVLVEAAASADGETSPTNDDDGGAAPAQEAAQAEEAPTGAPAVVEVTRDWSTVEGEIESATSNFIGAKTRYFKVADDRYFVYSVPKGHYSGLGSGIEENEDTETISPRTLFTSTDAVTWTETARFDEPWIADIEITADAVHAVRVDSDGEVARAWLATSTDDGQTWVESSPVELAVPEGDESLPILDPVVVPELVVVDGRPEIYLSVRRFLDMDVLVDQEVQPTGEWTVRPAEDGLRVYSTDDLSASTDEPVGVISWDDVPKELFFGGFHNQARYVESDGALVEMAWPFEEEYARISSTSGGTLAATQTAVAGGSDGATTVYHLDSDGTWTPLQTPESVGFVSDAGATPDGYVVVGQPVGPSDGPWTIAISRDRGTTWDEVRLGSDGFPLPSSWISDEGAIVSFPGAETETLFVSTDLVTWDRTDLDEVFPGADDAYGYVQAVKFGPGGEIQVSTSTRTPGASESKQEVHTADR